MSIVWNTGAAAMRFRLKNKKKKKMSKNKWDKLPLMTWKFTMYKEDAKGNQKFYEYTGDHSSFTYGMDKEDLNEIDKEDA